MNSTKIIGFLLLTLLIIPTSPLLAGNNKNLVDNSDFKKLDINGDPVGWLKGGYGENTQSYGFVACSMVYTEDDLKNTSDEPVFVFRPDCPPNTTHRLQTTVFDYINGDGKWYFKDIKIGSKKDFIASFDYQPYTDNAQAILRYTLKDKTYKYELLSDLPQVTAGGHGYIGWVHAKHNFTTPKEAKSLTIFFSVQGDGICGVTCIGPDRGTLFIANVSLVHDKQK